MKAAELIADLRSLDTPQDLNVILLIIADYLCEARLSHDGRRLCDVTDCKAWLMELAAEVGKP